MSFKENFKKKIRIEILAKTITVPTGAPGVTKKVDKEKVRALLSMSPYALEKRRDLELYHRKIRDDAWEVLVLDNELPLYGNTTLDDVTIRRSPELKEMISIRNIIKILNDSDILMSRGKEALNYIRDRSLESLNLRYGEKDIQDMTDEAQEALARADVDGVRESLGLFVEVLGFTPLPADVLVNDHAMYGGNQGTTGDDKIFSPVIMYNEKTNTLKLIAHRIDIRDRGAKDIIPAVALGKMQPDKEGPGVFPLLAKAILARKGPTIH